MSGVNASMKNGTVGGRGGGGGREKQLLKNLGDGRAVHESNAAAMIEFTRIFKIFSRSFSRRLSLHLCHLTNFHHSTLYVPYFRG